MKKESIWRVMFFSFWVFNLFFAWSAYYFNISLMDFKGPLFIAFMGLYNFTGFMYLTND